MASMSSAAATSSYDVSFGRRDHPWLLPTNRKLRNVISISLRNLSFAGSSSSSSSSRRHRGQTIDDDAVPNTLTSPAKIVAMREHKVLEHSRSSDDLRSVQEEADVGRDHGTGAGVGNGKDEAIDRRNSNGKITSTTTTTPPRPSITRMRRRSTMEWANATPQKRQERLENLTAERMASVFYTCHVEGVQEPIYVSETVPRTMNPTFRHLDLSSCGPDVTRLDAVTVRVWVKSAKMEHWRQLLQMTVELRGLQYLGQSLEQYPRALPQNTVIFELTDGVYTSFPSLVDYAPALSMPSTRANANRPLPSSSFDALLRLSKLDDSIQDAIATRNKIAADLEALLQSKKQALAERDEVAEAADRLKTIEYAKMTVERQLEKARKQQEEKRASLQTRKRLMEEDLQQRKLDREQIRSSKPELPHWREEREIKRKAIESQRRRICEDLQKCYPIQSIPKHSLGFTIRDLHLPNSEELDSVSPEEAAAALGHVAQLVFLLSCYLRQPIPYPLRPRSSTSTIEDPLSILKSNTNKSPLSNSNSNSNDQATRTYPLFPKGVPRFRFDYAVFLLNKNIQILLESAYNVRVVDIRHTLPNLKYLLYVATAGAGALPARKAGGVRGLLRVSSGGSGGDGSDNGDITAGDKRPGVTRFGSDGSTDSAFSGFQHGRGGKVAANGNGTGNGNGRPKSAVESLKRNFAGNERKGN